MVVVSVRETYDLHTVQNKMTVISIHTPKPDIIKRNFPGLLMQCKAYRPLSADVVISCASVLPLDPRGVGLTENDVAPEDVFNPILYSALSNKGMSQLEARINAMSIAPTIAGTTIDIAGQGADVDVDDLTNKSNEFAVYYGLLSNAHGWKKANPQAGVVMRDLRPLVYDMVYNVGDQNPEQNGQFGAPAKDGTPIHVYPKGILGKAKPMPFINCLSYTNPTGQQNPGFDISPANTEQAVSYVPIVVAGIIIPPSRLHELFYRMTVTWRLEFTAVRPISEISSFTGLEQVGNATHFQNYSYGRVKEVITGSEESVLDNDSCMVASNVDVEKVM